MQPRFGLRFENHVPATMQYGGHRVSDVMDNLAHRLDAVMPGDQVTLTAQPWDGDPDTEEGVAQAQDQFRQEVQRGVWRLLPGFSLDNLNFPNSLKLEVKTARSSEPVAVFYENVDELFIDGLQPKPTEKTEPILGRLVSAVFEAFEQARAEDGHAPFQPRARQF